MDNKMFSGFVSYDCIKRGAAGYAFGDLLATQTPAQTKCSSATATTATTSAPNVPLVVTTYHTCMEVETPIRTYTRKKNKPDTPPPPQPQCPLDTASAAPAAPAQYYGQVVQEVSISYVGEPQYPEDKQEDNESAIAPAQYNGTECPAADTADASGGGRRRSVLADPASWAGNVRKLKHQRGEAYVSRRGKLVPPRAVRNIKDCLQSCKHRCSRFLSETDRQNIFKAFYSLSVNEKKHFLLNTTERTSTKRPVKMSSAGVPRRRYAYKYFFLVRAVRYTVCKSFYLGTLAISQKPVYNVHEYKSEVNTPKPDGRGRSDASAHGVSPELKEAVRRHVQSYVVGGGGGGGGGGGRRQYLPAGLTLKRMYRAYAELCERDGRAAVKESMYRKIFGTHFNLHFRKRRPERCDSCQTALKKK